MAKRSMSRGIGNAGVPRARVVALPRVAGYRSKHRGSDDNYCG